MVETHALTIKFVKKSLLRWCLRHCRWTATTVQKTTPKLKKKSLWSSTCAVCASRVTRGALVAHWYTYAPPRCRTLQLRRTFIPLSVSLSYDLSDPVFDVVGLSGFKRVPMIELLLLLREFLLLTNDRIIIIKQGWQCKALRECSTMYQSEVLSPTIPTHRMKEEKGKSVGDKQGASS